MLEAVVFEFSDTGSVADGPVWIEALPAKVYKTAQYGEVVITPEKLHKMAMNFKSGVRGQEIAVDYEHGMDQSKGLQAAGWYKDFAVRSASADPTAMSLWALVDFTDDAKKEIADKKWKYFSLEWDDKYSGSDGASIEDVIIGGGITNRPVAKHTLPINFSETMWEDLTAEDRKKIAADKIGTMTDEEMKKLFDLPSAESKEWEHSEPGISSPPPPRTSEDGSDDPAIGGGWRRDTPPIVKEIDPNPPDHLNSSRGGNTQMEFVFAEKDARELLKVLDLDSDTEPAKVVENLKVKFGELDTLRRSVDSVTQEKAFAEQYPQYWAEHAKLMERDREHTAKTFCESVTKIRKAEGYGLKETKQGLSVQAQEKIVEVHKKFSDGTATVTDFEECVKTITNGGILQFGEIGTSEGGDEIPEIDTNSATGVAAARKYFAEAVAKVQKEHGDWDYQACIAEAGRKYPDLAQAYMVTLPA